MSTQAEAAPVRRRWSRQARHQMIYGWAFALPFFLLFLLVFAAPIISSIRSSLFKMQSTGGGLFGGGERVEVFAGLENFIVAATNTSFWGGIGRVMLFGVFQIPVMIGIALGLALLLDSFLVRRPGTWRLLYFLPYAIPGLIAAIVWGYLYVPQISPFADAFGTSGGQPFFLAPGIILASMANMTTWTFTGYNMLIFLAALQAIPGDLYEAARIDGASGLQITAKIKIPLVRGAALLAVLLSIIGTIQLFNEPTVMQTLASWMGNDYTPMMMAYNTMMGQMTPSGAGPASAVSILMAMVAGVLAVIYALAQRKAD
ncbi:carbohydrate ABC transporter permease [Tessaracoccus antarcticus]|uniref:Sugar ABC transporter permease n=1 Tax=Tessaracoccus antarcticus TaxID=2479848 RepID=A0A3M0G010_9ACTN|nr:sugar ABC transporter permease [Tessaracoccus antarcticus]RMB57507.1 sugar ABC transporter permease [Tessaracoccus antarcticus]